MGVGEARRGGCLEALDEWQRDSIAVKKKGGGEKTMRTSERSTLEGNAWVRRLGELRQMVDDAYDPTLGTPMQWVEWVTTEGEQEFDMDDIDELLDAAERLFEREQGLLKEAADSMTQAKLAIARTLL